MGLQKDEGWFWDQSKALALLVGLSVGGRGYGSPREWPELGGVGVDPPTTLVGPSFSSTLMCSVQAENQVQGKVNWEDSVSRC